jgi:hypothetical protein
VSAGPFVSIEDNALNWWISYRRIATLNNGEKFIELNLLTAIFIHHGHDLSHLLPIFNQTKGDQGVLQLIHSDGT